VNTTTKTKSTKRPLDWRAYTIVAMCIILAFALLGVRLASSGKLDRGPSAVALDRNQAQWVFTSKKLYVTALEQKTVSATLDDLNLLAGNDSVSDAAAFASGILVLTRKGELHHCELAVSKPNCKPSPLKLDLRPESGKLALNADESLLALVDNERGKLHLIATATSKLVSEANTGLYRPNRPHFDGDQLILANTGQYRITRWSKQTDGQFNPAVKPDEVMRTNGQPYYVLPYETKAMNDWLVIEAGSTLLNGEIVRYANKARVGNIDAGIKDPSSIARAADGTILISGMKDQRVTRLVNGQVAMDAQTNRTNEALVANHARDAQQRLIMNASLVGMCMLFALPLLVLWLMGYELGQSINNLSQHQSTPIELAKPIEVSFNHASYKAKWRLLTVLVAVISLLSVILILLVMSTKLQSPVQLSLLGLAAVATLIAPLAMWRYATRNQSSIFEQIVVDNAHLTLVRDGEQFSVPYTDVLLFASPLQARTGVALSAKHFYLAIDLQIAHPNIKLLPAILSAQVPPAKQFTRYDTFVLRGYKRKHHGMKARFLLITFVYIVSGLVVLAAIIY
jgi:hypothetical protein